MNARMLVVAVMLAPGAAMANGPRATSTAPAPKGHIEVPWSQINRRCVPRRTTAPEKWDTPVDKEPDWDQKEAADAAGKNRPLVYCR